MKFVVWILFCFTCASSLQAQKTVPKDSSKVSVRSVNQSELETLRQDKDFQYENYLEPPQSLWDKFWNYIWYRIRQIMSTRSGRITVWTALVIIALVIIGFFVMKVTGMNKAALFNRRDNEGLPYTVLSDNIHGISFEDAIKEAVRNGNYRLAIRLLYLQSLKKLSDKEYIDWHINKTNTEYIAEVMNKPWHSLFKYLTLKFEYAWYGEISINQNDFESLQVQFQQFNNQLQ